MSKVTLGKTGITVEKNALGCLPIQRVTRQEAIHLLRKAFEGGIRFFDTARMYSDSESKVGEAFDPVYHNAVMHRDDDNFGESVICEVFQTGFKVGEKVVRHAMVVDAN